MGLIVSKSIMRCRGVRSGGGMAWYYRRYGKFFLTRERRSDVQAELARHRAAVGVAEKRGAFSE